MFNIGSMGIKKEFKRKRLDSRDQQMDTQVKKILEQKEQGLILMVRG